MILMIMPRGISKPIKKIEQHRNELIDFRPLKKNKIFLYKGYKSAVNVAASSIGIKKIISMGRNAANDSRSSTSKIIGRTFLLSEESFF
jgi:hypothetical protein